MVFSITFMITIQASAEYKIYCSDPRPPSPPFTQVLLPNGDYGISAYTKGGIPMKVYEQRLAPIADLPQAELKKATLQGTNRGLRVLFCFYTAVNGDEFALSVMEDENDPKFQRCNQIPDATYIECF